MNTIELINAGAKALNLDVKVFRDGLKEPFRPARMPAPGVPAIYADVTGTEADIRAAYEKGFEIEMEITHSN